MDSYFSHYRNYSRRVWFWRNRGRSCLNSESLIFYFYCIVSYFADSRASSGLIAHKKEEWMRFVIYSSFVYFFSLALWQMTSIEKLKARAKAMHSHQVCLPNETIIITKQNKLTVTVNAFFSVKYLLNGEANDMNLFIVSQR